MIQPEFLYIEGADFILLDLYRFGNSSSPKLDSARPLKDILVVKQSGIEMVIANGNGVSLSSIFDPAKKNTWKLGRSTPIPVGLRMVRDLRPGRGDHFLIAPDKTMPLAKYIGLLQELAMRCIKVSQEDFVEKLDGLSLPMTMGDWVLIMESVDARIKTMKTVDPESLAEDDLAEMYTDQQNLEGILRYMKIEFEKAYGTLPNLDR